MANIPIAWQLSFHGADQVKSELSKINDEMNRGTLTQEQYAERMGSTIKATSILNRQNKLADNIWKAQHPSLQRLSKGMSAFGRVAQTTLSIMNAINLASIASQGISAARAEQELAVALAQKEFNDLLKEFGENAPQTIDALNKLNVEKAKLNELISDEDNQRLNNFVVLVSSIATAAATSFGALSRFGLELSSVFNLLTRSGGSFSPNKLAGLGLIAAGGFGLATGGLDALMGKSDKLEDKLKALGSIGAIGVGIALEFPAIAKIALIGTAIAVAVAGIVLFRKEIAGFFEWLAVALQPTGEAIMTFFTVDLPNWFATSLEMLTPLWDGIKAGFTGLVNGLIIVVNSLGSTIVTGLNAIGQAIINAVNWAIKQYTNLKAKAGVFGKALPSISPLVFTPITFTPIEPIKAAHGFEGIVNKDTLFRAGEAGPEFVSIRPGLGKGSGQTIVNHIHIEAHGSILSEKELFRKIDDYFQNEFRSHGFGRI